MSQPPILEIDALSKDYRVGTQTVPVLAGLNLHIRAGEFVSIVGPSGCGKSTLLRLLVGLDEDYRGDMRLDGRRVAGTALDRAIVFQEHRLFPWLTVEQNVALGMLNASGTGDATPAQRRHTVAEHIARVGLTGYEGAFPHQLSGGMSQRVAIARALVGRPRILLLDEPFGALDALTRARMQQELQRIWQAQGITAVLVTHDVDEAVYLGDRVVVMASRPGRIARVIDVPMPRSRDRAGRAFADLRAEVLREIGHAPAASGAGGAAMASEPFDESTLGG